MGEEASTIDRQTPSHLYEHWCEEDGCKKWGGLGFRNSNNEEPRWWCSEHFPYKRTNEKSRPTE